MQENYNVWIGMYTTSLLACMGPGFRNESSPRKWDGQVLSWDRYHFGHSWILCITGNWTICLFTSGIQSKLTQTFSPHFKFQCIVSIFWSWYTITVHDIWINLYNSSQRMDGKYKRMHENHTACVIACVSLYTYAFHVKFAHFYLLNRPEWLGQHQSGQYTMVQSEMPRLRNC